MAAGSAIELRTAPHHMSIHCSYPCAARQGQDKVGGWGYLPSIWSILIPAPERQSGDGRNACERQKTKCSPCYKGRVFAEGIGGRGYFLKWGGSGWGGGWAGKYPPP